MSSHWTSGRREHFDEQCSLSTHLPGEKTVSAELYNFLLQCGSSVGGILLVAHQCGWHITGHSSAEIMMCGNFVRGNCGRARREWLVVVALFVLFVLSRLPASPPGSQTPNWWLDALGWWVRWPRWVRWARCARWGLSRPVQWLHWVSDFAAICQFEQTTVGCYQLVNGQFWSAWRLADWMQKLSEWVNNDCFVLYHKRFSFYFDGMSLK